MSGHLRKLVDHLKWADAAVLAALRSSPGSDARALAVVIALHGAYHRGQVALVVRGGGGEPASTDYIGFVRGVPAARTVPSSLATATR
jgi:hypothetical protein